MIPPMFVGANCLSWENFPKIHEKLQDRQDSKASISKERESHERDH